MPLSEDEQRILQDIERNFYEHDPKFAASVGANGLYRHARRNLKLSALGFVVGLGLLLVLFFQSPLLGLIGFGVMLASAAMFVRNLHRIGQMGMKDAAEAGAARQPGESFDEFRARLINKFRRQ